MAENRAIGAGNSLPWHLPDDMKWFRESTRGKTLLMGRKTYASIGRPLPHRRTWVLSRSSEPIAGVEVMASYTEVIAALEKTENAELWICGGAQIYAQTLPWWDELLLTHVKRVVSGDAFFPAFKGRFTSAEVIRETDDLRIERYLPTGTPGG